MQRASHSKAVTNTIESAIPLHPYSAIISCPDVSRRIHLSCKRLFNLESMTSESCYLSCQPRSHWTFFWSAKIFLHFDGCKWGCLAGERPARCKNLHRNEGGRYPIKGTDDTLSCIDDIANRIHRNARTILVSGACPLKAI